MRRDITYAAIERIITTFDEADIIRALGNANKIGYRQGMKLEWDFCSDDDGKTTVVATQTRERPQAMQPEVQP